MRYGVTRDYVLGLEVVLSDGTVLRTGRRTVKGVAGYDLTALFVGSEGTLGLITEATVRLRPAAPPAATLVAFFPSMEAAGTAIVAIRQAMMPSMLELMDQRTVTAVEEWKHMGLDTTAAAMVVAQADDGIAGGTDVEQMADICERLGSSSVVRSTNELEATMLVQARRLAIPAIEQRGTWLLDDVGVPCARIPDLLRRVEEIARAPRGPTSTASATPATATCTQPWCSTAATGTPRRVPRRRSTTSSWRRWTSAAPSPASTGWGR